MLAACAHSLPPCRLNSSDSWLLVHAQHAAALAIKVALVVRRQVGAAFAVLQEAEGAPLPLALQAAKSRALHTEPAAGAVGLAAMAAQLAQLPSPATLHLHHVNPHVAAIFQVLPASIHPLHVGYSWLITALVATEVLCCMHSS
jgi:hypothetical protein